jgi:hypothetical protein
MRPSYRIRAESNVALGNTLDIELDLGAGPA